MVVQPRSLLIDTNKLSDAFLILDTESLPVYVCF